MHQHHASDLREAKRLRLRMRLRHLSTTRVRLASYLGDAPSRCVFGAFPLRSVTAGPREERRLLRSWALGLRDWGKETWVRAALASAEAALGDYERRCSWDRGPRRALGAAARWLRCPCAKHAARARESVTASLYAAVDFSACPALRAAQAAGTEGSASLEHAVVAAEDAAWALGCPLVRRAVKRSLVPWALGYSWDPFAVAVA